jgi:hypothetical protein
VRPDDSLSQAVIDEERDFEWFESKGHPHSPNLTHQLMWVKS